MSFGRTDAFSPLPTAGVPNAECLAQRHEDVAAVCEASPVSHSLPSRPAKKAPICMEELVAD